MLFTQFEFIFIFLPAVLFFYERCRSSARRVQLLVLASLVFYGAWDYRFLALIMGSVTLNFFLAKTIARKPSKLRLAVGIFANLIPLMFFKYSRFFLETIGLQVTGLDQLLPALLPLGISFYTFQQIAYLVDVYKNSQPETSFWKYSFFTTFFPQLIAGPIVHHRDLIPQIHHSVDRQSLFFQGVIYFAIGFVKKYFIADSLAHFVDPIYGAPGNLDFQLSVIAILGYTFQLYFDFSGYSDMAMGLANLFGFTLPVNFMSPYKSKTIIEFWRRWHITLSSFLRDYLYVPLGGSRYGKLSRYKNLMLTMLIGGLWHGAGWTFVVWGGMHGLALAIHHFCRDRFPRGKVGCWGYPFTFVFVALLWVPFRAENLGTTLAVYKGLGNYQGFSFSTEFLWLMIGAVAVLGPSSHQLVLSLTGLPRLLQSYVFGLRRRMFVYTSCAAVVTVTGMVSFYTSELDRNVYEILGVPIVDDGISNLEDDFRSNLRMMEIFRGAERKVCIVGSSFTQSLGTLQFEQEGVLYKSSSAGIGGNGLINGLRTSMAVIDEPNMDTIILGISPLNLGPLTTKCSFPDECLEGVNRLGFHFRTNRFAGVKPITMSVSDVAHLALHYQDSKYSQLHGFLHKLSKVRRTPASVPTVEEFALESQEKFLQDFDAELSRLSRISQPVEHRDNGEDSRFHWWDRGILESLELEGDVYRALSALKGECARRGIRLVIYETPTPSHAEAPHIYPAGFLETYQSRMRVVCRELDIAYLDFSALFPRNRFCMDDFIHPQIELLKKLHKLLICRLFGTPSRMLAGVPNYRLKLASESESDSSIRKSPGRVATHPNRQDRSRLR